MALGYSVPDDADRLAHDPAFKMAVRDRRGDDVISERLASQPTQSRFISILAREGNREKFRDGLFESISRRFSPQDPIDAYFAQPSPEPAKAPSGSADSKPATVGKTPTGLTTKEVQ